MAQKNEGKIGMFVTLFWFSRKIRDDSSYKLNYTKVLSVYVLYCDKNMPRPHGARLLRSFESRQYM